MAVTPPMAMPRLAAGVLFRDSEGQVLLVKPTYRDGWDIPGGCVEAGETPKEAARREVREEIGIDAPVGRLLIVDWAPHPDDGDTLVFVFDGGCLASTPAPGVDAAGEIEAVRFWPVAEIARALPDRILERLVSALDGDGDPYLEQGARPPSASAW